MNWADEVVAVSGQINRTVPRPDRGVLETSHLGVSAIYVPHPETGRLLLELRVARVEVLGQASGRVSFVALVRSTDKARLDELIRGAE